MKVWQKILVALMCVLMVVMLIVALVPGCFKAFIPGENNPTEPTKSAEEIEHNLRIVVSFDNGIMTTKIKETCNCGETTGFTNQSKSKEAAMNILNTIQCADGVFYIQDGEEVASITRAQLVEKIYTYQFTSDANA